MLWIWNDIFVIWIRQWLFWVSDPTPICGTCLDILQNYMYPLKISKRKNQPTSTGITWKGTCHRNFCKLILRKIIFLFRFLFVFFFIFVWSGSETNKVIPDPGKNSGSNLIRIHNTACQNKDVKYFSLNIFPFAFSLLLAGLPCSTWSTPPRFPTTRPRSTTGREETERWSYSRQ